MGNMQQEPRFYAGDVVRFRSWDDMKSEFGENSAGCIKTPFTFVPKMRYLCGKEYRIRRITSYSPARTYAIWLYGIDKRWDLCEEMFEPVEEVDPQTFDSIALEEYLNSLAQKQRR